MSQRRLLSLAGTLVLVSFFIAESRADDAKWDRATMAKFLTDGWDTSPEGRALTDQQYEELISVAKGDVRLNHALALIRMKQLKFQDSLALINDIVVSRKNDLPAWRTKIWLTVLTKNYSQALLDMERAATVLASVDAPDEQQRETQQAFATFMGRIYGFLEGPVSTATPEAERVVQRKKTVAKLRPELQKVFEEGREAVTNKYLELTDQAIVSKEKAKENAEEEREDQLKGLDEEQKQLEKRHEDLTSQRDKLKSELKTELTELDQQIRPLDAQFVRLDAQAAGVRQELANFNAQIAGIQNQLRREKNPDIIAQLSFQLGRLNRLAANSDANFSALAREAAGIDAQRIQIRQRADLAANTIGRQVAAIDKDLADIQKKGTRNIATEKKLRKPPTADTPETRAKAAQAASFITYDQFPLEREKARLLDSFE